MRGQVVQRRLLQAVRLQPGDGGGHTLVVIGDNTTIREYVTINRGTAAKGKTVVGDNCLIMAYCHIAHDCIVGNNIIMGNATQLAGEVVIADYAILSAAILVHQFLATAESGFSKDHLMVVHVPHLLVRAQNLRYL